MNKRMTGLIVGGFITVAALGAAVGTGIGSAAEKNAAPPAATQGMMQKGSMGAMDPKMMESPEMRQQCQDMMKNADMQKAMTDMMKQPEIQGIMRQMVASDPEFRQMMTSLVNSSGTEGQADIPAAGPEETDHKAHHAS